ncbi:MAG: DUF2070 family protein [Aigarchaeota archaeon]|nr:DUF2070 family protein [Aigarchaeota archaeon]
MATAAYAQEASIASRYGLLFSFPSHRAISAGILLSTAAVTLGFHVTFQDCLRSMAFAAVLVVSNFVLNFLISSLAMKREAFLTLRRMNALSLIGILILATLGLLGMAFDSVLGLHRLSLPTISLSLTLFSYISYLVYSALSFSSPAVQILLTVFPASLQVYTFAYLFEQTEVLPYFVAAPIAAALLAELSRRWVDSIALSKTGFRGSHLIRGFLASWTSGDNTYLESDLSQMGAQTEVSCHIFLFRDRGTKQPLLALVVPGFHPGPFRSLGSSALPHQIEVALRRDLHIDAIVLHGLSGHDMNLVRAVDAERVVDAVVSACRDLESKIFMEGAELPKMLSEGAASSLRLKFGNNVLATLTLHPIGMEDIPPSISPTNADPAAVRNIVLVDTHNSFSGDPPKMGEHIDDLKTIVDRAIRYEWQTQHAFSVGFSRVLPKQYGLEDGMGPGGISVTYFKINGEECALIVIDGNNALPGLRDSLMDLLREHHIRSGELLTTDTHVVNALTTDGRGYHPVGEKVDVSVISDCVEMCLSDAVRKSRTSEVFYFTIRPTKACIVSVKALSQIAQALRASVRRLSISVVSSLILLTSIFILASILAQTIV